MSVILICSIYWLYPTSHTFGISKALQHDWAGDHTASEADNAISSLQNAEITVDNSLPVQENSVKVEDLQTSTVLPVGYSAAFPREIWQTSSQVGKEKYAEQMNTWKDVKGFNHHWLSDTDADNFVQQEFSRSRPSLFTFWNDLSIGLHNKSRESGKTADAPTNGVMNSTSSSAIVLRADLLRYMLMLTRGGVYADIDTSVLLHIDRWIPEALGSQVINAIIGIEYDDTTYKMFVRPISFCQWTLMAKPNHPIFERAVNRVISNLEFLARRQKVQSASQLVVNKLDVLEATGPGMISDVVLEVIRDQLPGQDISWATFHDQKEPKLYGDILVLPINGFAGNQKHSHAGNPDYGQTLVAHHFARSWYQPQQQKSEKQT